MKLKFESSLPYQLDAIRAVTELFEGMQPKQSLFELSLRGDNDLSLNELGIGNPPILQADQLLKNLHAVQEANDIPKSSQLIVTGDTYKFPNFSVEMETGTGKTYVYLRTIFELNQKYGFRKFIIVVPSVPIREGVISSIRLIHDHFRGLYDNIPFHSYVYNSKDLSKVRQFSGSNEIQIMIMTIQSFQKDAGDVEDYNTLSEEERKKLNVIHQERDGMSGRRPIEYVQSTKPVVIIDEPQSVDRSANAKRAIKTLNPQFCLRYSATHDNPYNVLYTLDPIKAYDMRLVKHIEVSSIQSDDNINAAFIRINSIGWAKNAKTPHAKATIMDYGTNGSKEKNITLKQNTDISDQTTYPGYDGYIVTNINAEPGLEHVAFANGKELMLQQEEGGMSNEVLKTQIKLTVEEHLKKEKRFKDKGIKVLSLFFIDKVSNYRHYDDDGNPQKGKLAEWFEEAVAELLARPMFQGLLSHPVDSLHDGYFAADRKQGKITNLKDSKDGKATNADNEAYELIMQHKERLLALDEPLRFIFSHSALKEGWDNPNVFQICSLREFGTEKQRRQTIGRGLRLPVNSDGERIYDDTINKLTVIASESFEEYAKGLQEDMEQDIGGGFKFGRVAPVAFSKLIDPESDSTIGQETSQEIWQALKDSGYLDADGDITDKFTPEQPGFKFELPATLEPIRGAITDEMKRYIFKNRVVDTRDRETLKYNKRIELNEDFKELWNRINIKTRYSVEFSTPELIQKAVDKIKGMDRIQAVRMYIEKTELDVNQAGVEGARVVDSRTETVITHNFLPDIVTYLQRETELTRGTLVEILKQSDRLQEFMLNPQAFMTEVAKLINRSLHEMVVDGIKYEQIEGQFYEMRLFEQREIQEYITRLYRVKSTDNRTPYDYIVWEFDVEREIAEKLDNDEKVKFFCKLPRWFKVATPLGDYNPDWAVVTEKDSKLYLVRETKSTHDRDKRRESENRKVACGKAHFKALNVNFEVATSIHEMLAE